MEIGNTEIVKALVDAGITVEKDIENRDGWKLIELIASHKKLALSPQLLDTLSIDLNAPTQSENIPWHRALFRIL